jgi:broad specificity phosphatase PhoE
MIRTLDTAYHVLHGKPSKILVWPDLREAHDAICNHGSPTINLIGRYPLLDFSECSEKWDYEQNTTENAQLRALRVRSRLERHSKDYKNILVVTHRGFIAHLVSGGRFSNCGKTFS